MPNYEFLNTLTGETEEHYRSIERRDCVPAHLKRILVPQRLAMVQHFPNDISAEATVPKALKALEAKKSWREIERNTGFSRDTLRRVWNF